MKYITDAHLKYWKYSVIFNLPEIKGYIMGSQSQADIIGILIIL